MEKNRVYDEMRALYVENNPFYVEIYASIVEK